MVCTDCPKAFISEKKYIRAYIFDKLLMKKFIIPKKRKMKKNKIREIYKKRFSSNI